MYCTRVLFIFSPTFVICKLFFFNGHTCNIWKFQTKGQIGAAIGVCATAMAKNVYSDVLPFFSFLFFRATPTAYRGSQARSQMGAAALSLLHSHNTRSKPHLRPTPELTETPDRKPTERGQGWNPHPHGYESGSLILCHNGNSYFSTYKVRKLRL